ncbi:MAG: phage major capsid protein [Bacteroidia bacterium]
MEYKKIKIDGLEGKDLETALVFNGMVDTIKGMNETITTLEGKSDKSIEFQEIKSNYDALKAEMVSLKASQINEIEAKQLSVADAILDLFEEKSLKSLADIKAIAKQEFEIKADNPLIAANYPGTFRLTKAISDVRFAPVRPYAFLNNGIKNGTVETDKNILLWTPGTRTQNVAYIGELADATTAVDGSTVSMSDKTRKMSKIVGRAIVSNDSFEDLSQLAQRVQSNLMQGMELWLDQKIWDGEGNDSTKPTEIYGVKTNQVTAFNSALVPSVEKPNVGDLGGAMKLQAKLSYHTCNTVWMSDTLAFKLQHTKDTEGNYIIDKLVDGTMMMAGLTVKTTELFGGSTEQMLVGDPSKIQFWVKRGLTAEFERWAKTDSYNLYVYARQQVLVEDEDIKGLIYVDNVATALQAIDILQVP